MMRELERTLRLVERLERDLQALLDSPLYQRIPRNQSVPGALRPTNILVSDPHYRKVAALWRAWGQYGSEPHPTREEIRRRIQAACHHFGTFAQLVVVRALHEFGYRAPPDTVLTRSTVVELSSPWGDTRLRCSEGAMSLELRNATLRLVPLLAPLTPDGARALWSQLREQAGNGADTVVLALGRPQDLDGVDEQTARAFAGWDWPRAQPISPWSLDAVERVARMLRGWMAPHRHTGYPPRAVVRPDPGVTYPKWMQRHGETLAIIAPTDAAERQRFSKECARRREELEREKQQANKARRAFDPGRLRALDELEALLRQAERLEPWTRCPVCETGRGIFEPRPASSESWDQWSWWCRCTQCSSEWGLRVCGSSACRLAYPVLEPAGCRRPANEDAPPPTGWVDRHYGRDLWAEPCWSSDSPHVFRCSQCGRCPENGCSRCHG
ncbi:hypothetical protein [Cystobacter ferrugineus]|nr:hypothetical protein [Cystobacter ferrugineus]